MKAVGQTVVTNVPRKRVADIAEIAAKIGRTSTYRAVIKSPLVRSGNDSRGSIQIPDLKKIRALSKTLFYDPGKNPPKKYRVAKSSGKVSGSGVSSCKPASTPKPTPKATPKPTAKPTPKPTSTPTDPPPSPTPVESEEASQTSP
jgi:hypothetical protein